MKFYQPNTLRTKKTIYGLHFSINLDIHFIYTNKIIFPYLYLKILQHLCWNWYATIHSHFIIKKMIGLYYPMKRFYLKGLKCNFKYGLYAKICTGKIIQFYCLLARKKKKSFSNTWNVTSRIIVSYIKFSNLNIL